MEIQKEKNLESWDYFVPVPCLSRTKYILLIVLLSVGCFIISIDGQFVFDDSEAIVNNKDVKLTTPIGELFYNDFWGTRMNHSQSHKSYRPITILSFRFNTWLNNGILSPYQFRLLNILLHCIVCLLSKNVFELLMGGNCCKAANLCAIIFSIHPIHTEAVAGIVGRAELLCAMFSFISLIFYNKAVNSVKYFYNVCYTLLSAIFVSLAMFSKEQGITMLGICFIYDVWIVNKLNVVKYILSFFSKNNFTLRNERLSVDHKRVTTDRFLCSRNNPKNECSGVKNANNDYRLNKNNLFIIYMLILRFIIILTTGLLLFYVRWKIMAGSPPTFQKFDNLAAFADSFIIRVINYNYIYALNSWLLLCPVWLCFDWSMGCVPLITHTNDIRIMFTILFWCTIILLFYRSLFFVDNKTSRSIIMALSFMIMSFLPASNLFFKVGFVIAERVLYLPSVGYCIIITVCVRYFLQYLMKNLTHHQLLSTRVTVIIFWLFVVCIFITRSILRSNEWRNETSLFQSALSVCPLNAKVHYNLGKVTVNKSLSLNYYKEAIKLNPQYDQAMNNLANLLKDYGNLEEAEELLRKSIKLRPTFAAAWMNLGIVLSNKKHYSEAEYCFIEAIKHRKHYPDCYYNLGNLYLDQKRYSEAGAAWRKAISQKPTHSVAWNNLVIMLDSIGKYEEAESTAMEALYILPTDAGIHFNLANSLGKLSRFSEAEKHFKIAIELNPNQGLYYVNLGVLYHRWKKYDNAKEAYKKALEINPELVSAERNLKML